MSYPTYLSAIANMEGGHLVIGVKDKTLEIVGTDISRLSFNRPTCKYAVCDVQTHRTMHLSVIRRFKHRGVYYG